MKDLRDLILGLSLLAVLTIRLTKIILIDSTDIDDAIDQAKRRVGPELGELLEAPAMTEEEMEAAEQEEETDASGE